MIEPYYEQDGITIFHGDCREILPTLPKVDLVLTDPPYCGVVADGWDNQWETESAFIEWIGGVLGLIKGRLNPNGSLYLFASPQMAARVEVKVREFFSVIGSAVWDKGGGRMGVAGSGIDVTALRTYWTSNTERCVFAEQYGSDRGAAEEAGYESACESAKVSVFGDYLRSEMDRAGATRKEIAKLFPSKTGGLTGCVSNWLGGANVPTGDQYETIRQYLNGLGGEFLRTEYEELRTEYEGLRRPFFLHKGMQWGDVWSFPIERRRSHPTQKPLPLISQIVNASSRIGGSILDPFMGSGTTLVAAKLDGRKAIGIELEEKYCEIAAKRLAQGVLDFG